MRSRPTNLRLFSSSKVDEAAATAVNQSAVLRLVVEKTVYAGYHSMAWLTFLLGLRPNLPRARPFVVIITRCHTKPAFNQRTFSIAPSGVQHENRDRRAFEHVLGHATEYQLAHSISTVGAHH